MNYAALQAKLTNAGISEIAAQITIGTIRDFMGQQTRIEIPEHDDNRYALLKCPTCYERWSLKLPESSDLLQQLVRSADSCPYCKCRGVVLA